VDLDLTDDQRLFLDTTHKFLTARWPTSELRSLAESPGDYDRSMWEQGAELGWTSLLVPDERGGGTISGRGVQDLGIILEELGRALFVGPVIGTNVAADTLARSGSSDLTAKHLPLIAAGEETVAWAIAEAGENWSAESGSVGLTAGPNGQVLNGVKTPVQDAHLADQLLVTVRATDGATTSMLIPADAPGVNIEVLDGLDLGRRFCTVTFDGAEVPDSAILSSGDPASGARQVALALALQCAETVGATSAAFDMTLEYVKQRKAFGRPIGSYQALKHRLAEMLFWLESSRAATSAALAAVQNEQESLVAARRAKIYVAKYCPAIVRDGLQMHGGIGFTWEHDIHLYLRRVDSNAAIGGGVNYHLDLLAPTLGF
jgi:alkylation response protein AidB-like acyl-CoA dehydrogenase